MVIAATIVSGIFIRTNNTLVTTAVMSIAPVPRPVASATYGFVRFIGSGLAPLVPGKLFEHYNIHIPFIRGPATVAAVVLATVHRALTDVDQSETHHPGPSHERDDAEQAVHDITALPEEAVLAKQALIEDRTLNAATRNGAAMNTAALNDRG